MAKRRNKGEERGIAQARIHRLLSLAGQASLSQGPERELAGRYAQLARRISMRYQLPLSPAQAVQVCRRCSTYRQPGRNTRVRIQKGRVVTTCLECGYVRRRPVHARPTAAPTPSRP